MILVLDTGNTNIEFGVFNAQKGDYHILAGARYFTKATITSDELGFFILQFLEINRLNRGDIDSLVYSSVVPQLNTHIEKMFRDYFNGTIIEVSSKINLGIENRYKNPSEVGSDRLVNAAFAFKSYKKNVIIIDMGTATTLCVVTAKGEYHGGVIIPGMLTSAQALFDKAAKLPAVRITKKERLLADTTSEAMEAGIYYSAYYALKGMIGQLAEEAGFKEYVTIATGGFASIFEDSGLFDVIDHALSIKGLKYIADINKS